MKRAYNVTDLLPYSHATYGFSSSIIQTSFIGNLLGLKNIRGDNISHFIYYGNSITANARFPLVIEKPNFKKHVNFINANALLGNRVDSSATITEIGDFNGDGKSDILVNTIDMGIGVGFGSVLIFGNETFGDKSIDLHTLNESQAIYFSVPEVFEKVGDVNGDGYDDSLFGNIIILGTNSTFNYTVNYIQYCNPSNSNKCIQFTLPEPTMNFLYLGYLGDFNGDGYDDIPFLIDTVIDTTLYIIFGRPDFGSKALISDLVKNGTAIAVKSQNIACSADNIYVQGFGLNANGDKFADLAINCPSVARLDNITAVHVLYGSNRTFSTIIPANESSFGFNYYLYGHYIFNNFNPKYPFYSINGGNLLGGEVDNIVACNPLFDSRQAKPYGICIVFNHTNESPLNLYSNNLTYDQAVFLESPTVYPYSTDLFNGNFGGRFSAISGQSKLEFTGDRYNDLLVPFYAWNTGTTSQPNWANTFIIYGGPGFPNYQILPYSPSPIPTYSPTITPSSKFSNTPTASYSSTSTFSNTITPSTSNITTATSIPQPTSNVNPSTEPLPSATLSGQITPNTSSSSLSSPSPTPGQSLAPDSAKTENLEHMGAIIGGSLIGGLAVLAAGLAACFCFKHPFHRPMGNKGSGLEITGDHEGLQMNPLGVAGAAAASIGLVLVLNEDY
jgi:hypothetical protein